MIAIAGGDGRGRSVVREEIGYGTTRHRVLALHNKDQGTGVLSKVWSAATIGIRAVAVQIETYFDYGFPKYTVVGLPDISVRESRERIQAAVTNSGCTMPRGVITINLAPADLRKEGSAFDLPIALSLLAAADQNYDAEFLRTTTIVGELALDGSVRPVRGVLPMAVTALRDGMKRVIVPADNGHEAALVETIEVYPVRTLAQAVALATRSGVAPGPVIRRTRQTEGGRTPTRHDIDFADVRGQQHAKRALEIAAAGGHNAIMIGPPGAGKTMLARRLPTILPPMTREEALETTTIHSVGGVLKEQSLMSVRPFRAPHHSISGAGLCGGGSRPTPGEISLAHNGVLFLDELPEFKRNVLDSLRQPLEQGSITITRANSTVQYPARFTLVAGMNPCPCGYLRASDHECVCGAGMIRRYLGRVSGPLLDRIDLHIDVAPVSFVDLDGPSTTASSAQIRGRVHAARQRQRHRYRGERVRCNAELSPRIARVHCNLSPSCRNLIRTAMGRLHLSARGYDRILKVARTVCDLDETSNGVIRDEHLAEAIQYRSLDRRRWYE